MRKLNLHHLRYFHAVAHEGNLTRAAERLHLSQSALSIQIRQLEASLGHDLFERRGRELHLTEAGRIALDYADVIVSAGDEMLGTLQGAERSRQMLRVGAMATLSRNFQITFLRPVLARGDVDLILHSGMTADLLRELETLNLDVVLVNQPPSRDSASPLVVRRLAEQRISLIGRADRFGSDDDAELADLLAAHPVVLPTADSGIRAEFDALTDRLAIKPEIAAEVDDMAMLRLMAREGVGLVVIPPIVVRDELENGRLVEFVRFPGIVESFYAVTVERRFPNPLVQQLVNELQVEAN